MFARSLPLKFLRSFLRHSSSSTSSPPPLPKAKAKSKPHLLKSYYETLRQTYPSAEPASLFASFLILHELTAVVPLVLGFFALRAGGVGEGVMLRLTPSLSLGEGGGEAEGEESWGKKKMRTWMKEGEEQAFVIGRRYGVLGYEKESSEERALRKSLPVLVIEEGGANTVGVGSKSIGGDIANLVVAYIVVKATLPLRLLLSVRLAPVMANSVVGRLKGLRRMGEKYLRKEKNG